MQTIRVSKRAALGNVREAASGALAFGRGPAGWGANEWYWIQRFQHPLHFRIVTGPWIGGRTWLPKSLTKLEAASLTDVDLKVLAFSASPSARALSAKDTRTPEDVLAALCADAVPDVRRAAGHNPSTPGTAIVALLERERGRGSSGFREVSVERQKRLWLEVDDSRFPFDIDAAEGMLNGYRSEDRKHLAHLASRRGMTAEMRGRLAQMFTLTEEAAKVLALDQESEVRSTLATYLRPEWSEDVALTLARDPEPQVRSALARSRAALSALRLLLSDDELQVRLALCHNASLDRGDRRILLEDPDVRVRRAIVRHGDFNYEELLSFDEDDELREALHERLQNPSQRLERTLWGDEFLRSLGPDASKSACSAASLSAERSKTFLRSLAESPHAESRRAASQVSGAPEDVLDKLSQDAVAAVRASALWALGVEEFTWAGQRVWWFVRPSLDVDRLATSSSAEVRLRMAKRARGETLSALCRDEDPRVRSEAASSANVSFSSLVELCDDNEESVRAAAVEHVVAGLQDYGRDRNRNYPRWVHDHDSDAGRRFMAAWAPFEHEHRQIYMGRGVGDWTSQARGELTALCGVADPTVRAAVARFVDRPDPTFLSLRALGADDLLCLMQDADDSVRAAALGNTGAPALEIAGRPNLPAAVSAGLARSSRQEIRAAVAGQKALPDDLLVLLSRDVAVAVRVAVATNPSTPRAVAVNLVRDADVAVRCAVASVRGLPAAAFRVLAEDPVGSVRASLASNANAPHDSLASLTHDTDEDVIVSLCGNPAAPADFLMTQVSQEPKGRLDSWRRLALNPATPPEALERLALSRDPVVRHGVALHPDTPDEALAGLCLDEFSSVSSEANANLVRKTSADGIHPGRSSSP